MTQYRVGRRAPFVTVPLELLRDPEADPNTIAVYAVIRAHADHTTGRNAYPSDQTIAAWAGCSERTVWHRRKKLRAMGWIEWKHRKGQTHVYTVHDTLQSTPGTSAGGAEVPAGGAIPDKVGSQEVREPPQEVRGGSARGAEVPPQEVRTTESHNREPITTSSDEEGRTAAAAGGLREFFGEELLEATTTLLELPGFTDREHRTFLARVVHGPDGERILRGIPPPEIPAVVAEAVYQYAEPRADGEPVRWKAVSFRRYLQVAADEHRAGIEGQRSAEPAFRPLSREEQRQYLKLRAHYEDEDGMSADDAAAKAYEEAISGRAP